MGIARVLFLADTHLGFDLPFRPRIQRRRRGYDFFKNYETALQPALEAKVDCVVHGGDILYRSKVPARLVEMAFEPLKQVADKGIPVYVVPGNHERSSIPHGHLASHPLIHVFDRPRTFILQKEDFALALAGFPFQRTGIRKDLLRRLDQTGWRHAKANGFLLCIHQSVDGATVGPANYRFRYAHDVVKITDIPSDFSAVLAGHIHRFQVLTTDLRGRPLPTPVFYPGSIERTSFAEKDEKKGYLILEFESHGPKAGQLIHWNFHPLYARPMIQLELHAAELKPEELRSWLKNSLAQLPSNSVVKLKINDKVRAETMEVVRAPSLRSLAPPSMNIDAVFPEFMRKYSKR
jgi:DNA repair exonuclease SbcCD nuclease subunit